MITNLSTYVLTIIICWILEKYIKLFIKTGTIQSDSYVSIIDHVAIDIETRMIDSGHSLEKEFTKFIHMNH